MLEHATLLLAQGHDQGDQEENKNSSRKGVRFSDGQNQDEEEDQESGLSQRGGVQAAHVLLAAAGGVAVTVVQPYLADMDNKDQDKGKGKGKYDPLTLAAAMHFTAAVLGVRAPEGSKVPSAVAKVMAACSVRPGGLLPAISAYIRSSYQQGQQLVEVDAAEGTGKHVFMDASVMHLEQAALAYEKTCGGLGAAFQAVPACVTQFQSHFHEEKGKEKEGTLVGEAQLGKREQELGCLRLYVSLLCRGLVAPTAPTSTQREGEGESCQSLYTRLSAVVGKPMSAPDVARELGVVSSGLLTWQRGRLGQVSLDKGIIEGGNFSILLCLDSCGVVH